DHDVPEHVLVDAVVVERLGGGPLVMPRDFAGLRPDRDDGTDPQAIAGPQVRIPWASIAGTPVDEVELGIVRTGHPRRSAPLEVRVALRPGLAAFLTGIGRRVTAIEALAGVGVVAVDKAAHTELAARHALHQHTVRDGRRRSDR